MDKKSMNLSVTKMNPIWTKRNNRHLVGHHAWYWAVLWNNNSRINSIMSCTPRLCYHQSNELWWGVSFWSVHKSWFLVLKEWSIFCGPFHKHGFEIKAWISNYIPTLIWVWLLISTLNVKTVYLNFRWSYYIPLFYVDVITYPCPDHDVSLDNLC